MGGSSFAITESFDEVVGIDFSHALVEAATRLGRLTKMEISISVEGKKSKTHRLPRIESCPGEVPTRRCHESRLPIGTFDFILMANLIDRLPDPAQCLEEIPRFLNTNGLLAITSPYTWLTEYTPKEKWLGGYTRDGEPARAHDRLVEPFHLLPFHRRAKSTISRLRSTKERTSILLPMPPYGEAVASSRRIRKVKIRPEYCATIGIVAIAFIFAGCSKDRPSNLLVVGMELSYPPFETPMSRTSPLGLALRWRSSVSRARQRTSDRADLRRLIPLRTGKIDLIISSMTRTDERAQSIDFSDSYLDTGLCILVPKDSDAKSIEDIDVPGTMVAVKQGTTSHIYANQYLGGVQLLLFEDEAAAASKSLRARSTPLFMIRFPFT